DSEDSEDADDDEEEETDEVEFDVVEEGTGSPPESIVETSLNSDDVSLRLETEDEVYIEVKGESGESYFEGMFNGDQSPEEFTIEEEKVHFNIGNSVALKIFVNDEELSYPVEPESNVHQKIWLHMNND